MFLNGICGGSGAFRWHMARTARDLHIICFGKGIFGIRVLAGFPHTAECRSKILQQNATYSCPPTAGGTKYEGGKPLIWALTSPRRWLGWADHSRVSIATEQNTTPRISHLEIISESDSELKITNSNQVAHSSGIRHTNANSRMHRCRIRECLRTGIFAPVYSAFEPWQTWRQVKRRTLAEDRKTPP